MLRRGVVEGGWEVCVWEPWVWEWVGMVLFGA